MATSLMPTGRQRYFTNGGAVASKHKLYTYAAGTNTPKATFTDAAGTIPHANPIELDLKGEALIYWSGAYKVDLKAPDGTQITGYPVDNYLSFDSAINNAVTTADQALRAALLATSGSAMIGYLDSSPGSTPQSLQSRLRKQPDHATGFWPDAAPAGVIQRLYDRVFIGGATECDGTLANVGKDWMETERAFTTRNSQFACTSTIGQAAILGSSRTSDSLNVGSEGCIGILGFAVNNNATQIQSAYAGYFEARKKPGGGRTHGIEIDIVNQGAGVVTDPYGLFGPQGLTNALWVASGGGVAGANPASVGIAIVNNGQTFFKGIVFQGNAIEGTDGVTGVGTAMAFAKGHVISWFNSSGAQTSYMYSAATTTSGACIILDDMALKVVDQLTGVPKFQVAYSGASVNYVGLLAGNTGVAPTVQALGTDANIDIRLAPIGNGCLAVTYGSTVAGTPGNFSAKRFLPFKDGNNVQFYLPLTDATW